MQSRWPRLDPDFRMGRIVMKRPTAGAHVLKATRGSEKGADVAWVDPSGSSHVTPKRALAARRPLSNARGRRPKPLGYSPASGSRAISTSRAEDGVEPIFGLRPNPRQVAARAKRFRRIPCLSTAVIKANISRQMWAEAAAEAFAVRIDSAVPAQQ